MTNSANAYLPRREVVDEPIYLTPEDVVLLWSMGIRVDNEPFLTIERTYFLLSGRSSCMAQNSLTTEQLMEALAENVKQMSPEEKAEFRQQLDKK